MQHDGTAPTMAPDSGSVEPLAYTLEQAAALLQISPDTYYRRVRLGLLPGRKLGGQWRVPRVQLHRFINEGAEPGGEVA